MADLTRTFLQTRRGKAYWLLGKGQYGDSPVWGNTGGRPWGVDIKQESWWLKLLTPRRTVDIQLECTKTAISIVKIGIFSFPPSHGQDHSGSFS